MAWVVILIKLLIRSVNLLKGIVLSRLVAEPSNTDDLAKNGLVSDGENNELEILQIRHLCGDLMIRLCMVVLSKLVPLYATISPPQQELYITTSCVVRSGTYIIDIT